MVGFLALFDTKLPTDLEVQTLVNFSDVLFEDWATLVASSRVHLPVVKEAFFWRCLPSQPESFLHPHVPACPAFFSNTVWHLSTG